METGYLFIPSVYCRNCKKKKKKKILPGTIVSALDCFLFPSSDYNRIKGGSYLLEKCPCANHQCFYDDFSRRFLPSFVTIQQNIQFYILLNNNIF